VLRRHLNTRTPSRSNGHLLGWTIIWYGTIQWNFLTEVGVVAVFLMWSLCLLLLLRGQGGWKPTFTTSTIAFNETKWLGQTLREKRDIITLKNHHWDFQAIKATKITWKNRVFYFGFLKTFQILLLWPNAGKKMTKLWSSSWLRHTVPDSSATSTQLITRPRDLCISLVVRQVISASLPLPER